MQKIRNMRSALWLVVVGSLVAAAITAVACGGTETVIQTVVVEKEVPVEVQVTVQVEVTATAAPRGPISREDTFVITGFGPGATQWTDAENMNPYSLGGLGRVRGILNKTIYEFLYLYNHNDGQVIPWLAESSKVDDDFMGVSVILREGIEWSDGMPFTSGDVKFTIELLMNNVDMVFAGDIQEWVKDVEIIDDLLLLLPGELRDSPPDPAATHLGRRRPARIPELRCGQGFAGGNWTLCGDPIRWSSANLRP